MVNDDRPVEELAREIAAYLDMHPDAADSLEGVIQCWVLQDRFLRGIGHVAQALERLIASGEIERIIGPDNRPIFRAGPRRRPPC